jgi:hypothetical protein
MSRKILKVRKRMNDLLDAANSSEDDSNPGDMDDSSEERYEKVKKEEAGTADKDPAKQRYDEIKEKAKKELMKDEEEKEDSEDEEQFEYEEDEVLEEGDEADEESFITY